MINLVIDILKADANVIAITTADRIYPLSRLEGATIPAIVASEQSRHLGLARLLQLCVTKH